MKKLCLKLSSAFMFSALLSACVCAQTGLRTSESFNAPLGGLPGNWEVTEATNPQLEKSVVEVAQISGQNMNALLMRRPGAAPVNSAVYYRGEKGAAQQPRFADVSLSVVVRFTSDRSAGNLRGFIVRAAKVQYGLPDGYYIAFNPLGKERGLGIYWNPATHTKHGAQLAFTPFGKDLVRNKDYLLLVTAKGPVLTAVLSEVNADETKGAELAAAGITDAKKTISGYLGLRTSHINSGPVDTYFRMVHISTLNN